LAWEVLVVAHVETTPIALQSLGQMWAQSVANVRAKRKVGKVGLRVDVVDDGLVSEVARRGKKVLNHRFHHRRSRKDSVAAASTRQIHPNLRRGNIKLKVVLFVNAIPGHDVLNHACGYWS